MTLAALAADCGVSAAFLSQIENGVANPTLGALTQITDALGTTLGHLLSPRGAPRLTAFEPSVRRAPLPPLDPEQGRVWDFGAREAVGLRAVVVHGPPGDHAVAVVHEGEEVVCVVSGEYELHVGGRSWRLSCGDVAHYDPRESHHLVPVTPRCSALVVLMHA
jgi:quercetin dioxygenase-like cupin family protein